MGRPSLRCNWPCETCGLAGFVFHWTWTQPGFHLGKAGFRRTWTQAPGLGRIVSLGLDLPLCKGSKAGFLMPCPAGGWLGPGATKSCLAQLAGSRSNEILPCPAAWVQEQRNPALPSWLGPGATKSCLAQLAYSWLGPGATKSCLAQLAGSGSNEILPCTAGWVQEQRNPALPSCNEILP
jgi:hypothetical protein